MDYENYGWGASFFPIGRPARGPLFEDDTSQVPAIRAVENFATHRDIHLTTNVDGGLSMTLQLKE